MADPSPVLPSFTGAMVQPEQAGQPGLSPLSPGEPLPPLPEWLQGKGVTPLQLFLSRLYLLGNQPAGKQAEEEFPGFLGTSSGLNERAVLMGNLVQQFYTGHLDASGVQKKLQQAIRDDPDTYPLQTLSEGLRAIGYQTQYNRKGELEDMPTAIPEAFPEPGQPILPPQG